MINFLNPLVLTPFLGLIIRTLINSGLFPVTTRTFFVSLARVPSQMILVCTFEQRCYVLESQG